MVLTKDQWFFALGFIPRHALKATIVAFSPQRDICNVN